MVDMASAAVGFVTGGGLVGFASFGIALRKEIRETRSLPRLQWLVSGEAIEGTTFRVSWRPVGVDGRDVRIIVGGYPGGPDVPPIVRSEWPQVEEASMPIDLGPEPDTAWVLMIYSTSYAPRRYIEEWWPILDRGQAANRHFEQESAPWLLRVWRRMLGRGVGPGRGMHSDRVLTPRLRAREIRRHLRMARKASEPP